MKVLIQKNIKTIFLVVLLIKMFILTNFVNPTIIYRGENAAYEFNKEVHEEYKYCEKIMEEYFNKNLIMTEEENLFQKSNNCWICKKFINDDEEKVRDHCHVTGKFRGAAHESLT